MIATLVDIVIILAVGVVVTLIFGRLRLPTLVGLFAAGALVGPKGLGLIGETEEVRVLAEVGVVFLLFTLGLEFSFRRMLRLAKVMLVAGPLQVLLTGAAGAGVGLAFGLSGTQATVLGMLVALSSTAVVLKTLSERGEMETPVGRNALGILIFQDILVVPMMLALPLLGGGEMETSFAPYTLVGIVAGVIVAVVVGTKWIAPRVLYEAARSRSPEVFLMAVVVICFGVAALSASLGLSLALGAFLAGLIISESEYSHQALGYVLPFQSLLMSFFFVSVGMLLDLGFLARYWWMVLLGALGLMAAKTLFTGASVLALRYPLRVAVGTGLSLNQVGEFSFVLAAVAATHSLLPQSLEQGFLGVAVLTMALTPVEMSQTQRVYKWVNRLPLRGRLGGNLGEDGPREEMSGHLVIVGYGTNGRNLARAADELGLARVVLELNPETVRREARGDSHIHYGDATNESVLLTTGVTRARAAAVVIGDPAATRGIVAGMRRLNPDLYIIARARFISEVQPLYDLGASDVVPEEFETSLELFRRTAQQLSVPEEQVEALEQAIRDDHYRLLSTTVKCHVDGEGAATGPVCLYGREPDESAKTD